MPDLGNFIESSESLVLENIDDTKDFIHIINVKEELKFELHDKKELKMSNDSVLNEHAFRVVQNKVTKTGEESEIEKLKFIISNIDNIRDYCTVCGNELDIKTGQVYWCKNDECNEKEEYLLTGDTICNTISSNPIGARLIVEIGLYVAKHSLARLVPYPLYFIPKKYERLTKLPIKTGTIQNEYSEPLRKLLVRVSLDKFLSIIDTISSYKNDINIRNCFGEDVYALLKYFIRNIYYNISYVNVQLYRDNTLESNNIDICSGFNIYEIKYPEFVEAKYNNGTIMYHGSSCANWYPIIRNGLKNLSNTKLMTAGAVQGAGVYLSPNVNTAARYCKSFNNRSMLGVAKLLDAKKYDKGGGIYTVPDEKKILLKYLIVVSGTPGNINSSIIQKYVTHLNRVKLTSSQKFFNQIKKRLIKEKEDVDKHYGKEIEVSLKDTIIEIRFTKHKINIDGIITSEYPGMPPIFVIKHSLKSTKDIPVNEKGLIMSESVHIHNWSVKTSLKTIIGDIKKFIHKVKVKDDKKYDDILDSIVSHYKV